MTDCGNCPKCDTPLVMATGVGTYCPNQSCTYERDLMRAALLESRRKREALLEDAREWADDLALSGTAGDTARFNILTGLLTLLNAKRPDHPSWNTESKG